MIIGGLFAPPGTLRSRLLAGLLIVTGAGLLVSSLISVLTLRAFITERLEAQLLLTTERAMVRLDNDTPPVGVDAPSPSPYFVVLLNPETGEVNQIYGDTLREDVVLNRLAHLSLSELRSYASSQEIVELDTPDERVPPHLITVRMRPNSIMVSGVPTDEREDYPRQLVTVQLITAILLLGGLLLIGGRLIVRALAPLDRMATTAGGSAPDPTSATGCLMLTRTARWGGSGWRSTPCWLGWRTRFAPRQNPSGESATLPPTLPTSSVPR